MAMARTRRGGSALTVWARAWPGSLTGIAHGLVWGGGDPLTFRVSPRARGARPAAWAVRLLPRVDSRIIRRANFLISSSPILKKTSLSPDRSCATWT